LDPVEQKSQAMVRTCGIVARTTQKVAAMERRELRAGGARDAISRLPRLTNWLGRLGNVR